MRGDVVQANNEDTNDKDKLKQIKNKSCKLITIWIQTEN